MKWVELLPAVEMGLAVIAALALMQLMPFGETTVLVRVSSAKPEAALWAAAAADAALVSTPAEGFAVLHGDAPRIRQVLGFTVAWSGKAPCFRKP